MIYEYIHKTYRTPSPPSDQKKTGFSQGRQLLFHILLYKN